MPNNLVIAIGQNKETFRDCRLYLVEVLGTKEQVLKLEEAQLAICIPYYISYIEAKGVKFLEAINYFYYENTSASYQELVKTTLVGVFRKLENKDNNYIPY